VAAIPASYDNHYGDFRLDLSKVKFTAKDHKSITVTMTFGDIRIVVPPNVDVTVMAHAGAGDINVLGEDHSGLNKGTYTITDNGPDGPGGGSLVIDASVRAGEVEVVR
jgi:predicted membrane protein